jgi:hypothetical protein
MRKDSSILPQAARDLKPKKESAQPLFSIM